jgi:BR serine/threonine kinase
LTIGVNKEKMSKDEGAGGGGSGGHSEPSHAQYVGPYRLDKTLGKGQTGNE